MPSSKTPWRRAWQPTLQDRLEEVGRIGRIDLKAMCLWTFVCWEFSLNHVFNFSTCEWSVHVFNFFLLQLWEIVPF